MRAREKRLDREPFEFTFVKTIPKKYGTAKGFMKYKRKLLVLCEFGILELIELPTTKKEV